MYTPVLVIVSLVVTCSALTTTEYENLKNVCDQQLIRNQAGNIPTLVRLCFHDCVGTQGCDGCVDLGNADNNGLAGVYAAIRTAYDNHVDPTLGVTFADFVALCGIEAVERSGYNRNSVFTFKYGRSTSSSCTGANNDVFPSALDGYTETRSFLMDQFGLTERETIVLLGAHSLGDARTTNSGFRGPWTNSPNRLDNEYYRVLLDAEEDHWRQINVPGGRQWEPPRPTRSMGSRRTKRQNPRPLMMLNSDMCLVKDINVNANGVSSCATDVATCANSPGRSVVEELAADNNAFTTEFITVFTKMIEKTSVTLQDVVPDNAQNQGTDQGTNQNSNQGQNQGSNRPPPKHGSNRPPKRKNPPRRKSLNDILRDLLDEN